MAEFTARGRALRLHIAGIVSVTWCKSTGCATVEIDRGSSWGRTAAPRQTEREQPTRSGKSVVCRSASPIAVVSAAPSLQWLDYCGYDLLPALRNNSNPVLVGRLLAASATERTWRPGTHRLRADQQRTH